MIPLDPGHARCMPDGQASGVAHARRRRELRRARCAASRRIGAHVGVLRAAMTTTATTAPGSTSARAPASSSRVDDEGESWTEIAGYLPADLVGRGRDRGRLMADLHLPRR